MERPGEEALAREGEEVVRRVARRMRRRLGGAIAVEDLESLGRVALAEALRSYDPARGSFGTFVGATARWAMLTGVRRELHGRDVVARAKLLATLDRAIDAHREAEASVEPSTEEAQLASLTSLLDRQVAALAGGLVALRGEAGIAPRVTTPEEQLLRAESECRLAEAIRALPDREQQLVRRHYFDDERFETIAADLGISKSRASRLHTQAIESLGKTLARSG